MGMLPGFVLYRHELNSNSCVLDTEERVMQLCIGFGDLKYASATMREEGGL